MYKAIVDFKKMFGVVPEMYLRTYNKVSDIKLILEKLYDYTSKEAENYAETILKSIYDEAVKANLPNRKYINRALDKRIKSLMTGTDIGANATKLSNKIEKLMDSLEKAIDKVDEFTAECLKTIEQKQGGKAKMDNTVTSRYNPNYRMHTLVKYKCQYCDKSFILNKKQVDDIKDRGMKIICPYCGNCETKHIEDVAMADDPDSIDDLGCMGIGHIEKEEKKEERSMVIVKKVYIYNPCGGDSRLVVSDKDVINGAENYDLEEATLMIKGKTMKEWVAEQRIIDSQKEDYEIVDDRY